MQNQENQNQGGANQQPKQIQMADNIPGAEYANFMQSSHNKEEFKIVFGNIMPPSGRITGKIITTPGHFKRMIVAMKENLKKYEEKFGEVKEATDLKEKEIGFNNK
ncbi:MAG: DUF3467 domain-containing protein [Patescibacteria group bacterium]|nr:DUF3467 domain-containing protein [Patescibacteria group bacterium]